MSYICTYFTAHICWCKYRIQFISQNAQCVFLNHCSTNNNTVQSISKRQAQNLRADKDHYNIQTVMDVGTNEKNRHSGCRHRSYGSVRECIKQGLISVIYLGFPKSRPATYRSQPPSGTVSTERCQYAMK